MNFHFQKDGVEIVFSYYQWFESFSRPLNINTIDYMNDLHRGYSNIKVRQMELPDEKLVRLLKFAISKGE